MFGRYDWNRGIERFDQMSYVIMRPGYPEGVELNDSTANALQLPPGITKVFDAYLLRHSTNGRLSHWLPTAEDLFATDWQWISNENACSTRPPTPGLTPVEVFQPYAEGLGHQT